jgi:hypothetical protein
MLLRFCLGKKKLRRIAYRQCLLQRMQKQLTLPAQLFENKGREKCSCPSFSHTRRIYNSNLKSLFVSLSPISCLCISAFLPSLITRTSTLRCLDKILSTILSHKVHRFIYTHGDNMRVPQRFFVSRNRLFAGKPYVLPECWVKRNHKTFL